MKKIVGYIRTSTSGQSKGLESQLRKVNQYAQSKDLKIDHIYQDHGVSGMKVQRLGLEELMREVRAGFVKIVIVPSFSRFGRSTVHLLKTVDEFKTLEVTFISISEQIDTSTPTGRVFMGLISLLSQLERDVLSERTKNGLINAKAKGIKLGRKKIRNSALIRELRSSGYKYRDIAKLAGCSQSSVCRELKEFVSK